MFKLLGFVVQAVVAILTFIGGFVSLIGLSIVLVLSLVGIAGVIVAVAIPLGVVTLFLSTVL